MHRYTILIVQFLMIATSLVSTVTMAAPVIFYSDLNSAPKNAYVTLWGMGFGERNGTILIADQPTSSDQIIFWSNTKIEFQLPVDDGQGITIQTESGEMSNLLAFSARRIGNIYFVSSNNGDNSNDGSYDNPWMNLSPVLSRTSPG